MILLNESNNEITKEVLDSLYINNIKLEETDKFNIPEIVIDGLISVIEKSKLFSSFENEKNIIRQYVAEKLFEELERYTPDKDSAVYLNFSEKVDAFFFCYKLFLNIKESDFEDSELYNRINRCKDRARIRQDFSYLPEIIVSLTSFPGRIDKVYKALNSIFTQSFKGDRVILWLAEEQFPEKENELPKSLTEYIKLGLEVRWCKEDLRPHKKYFYVMQEYPNALIITVDDDLVYDGQMIEALITSYLHFPEAISAARTHLIKKDIDGNISSYSEWEKQFSGVLGIPSMQLFSTSGAGTLYPPDCIDKAAFTLEDIKSLCLNADDLWLKVMQLKKGTPVVLARNNEKLKYIPETQADSLKQSNVNLNENDLQLRNILDKYDVDGKLTEMIFSDDYTAETSIVGLDIVNKNDFGLLEGAEQYLCIVEKNKILLNELNAKYDDLYVKFKDANERRKKLNDKINALKEKNTCLNDKYTKLYEKHVALKEKNASLNEKYKKLYEDYKQLNADHKKLDTDNKKLKSDYKALNNKYDKRCKELDDIRNSVSYKIGRIITYIPRKIREIISKNGDK